jgi:hypothetical protein
MLPDIRIEMGERLPFLGRLGVARS